MKAFAILSLIILSSYVSAFDQCQFDISMIINGSIFYGISILGGNDKHIPVFINALKKASKQAAIDCNHSQGGSITEVQVDSCFEDIKLIVELADGYLKDKDNSQISIKNDILPKFTAVLEKLRYSCSPLYETKSRNFLLEKQARVHSMLRTDSDPDYDICLNDVAPVMKSSGEIKKLVQEAVETSDFTKVDTAFAQAIDIIQRFQGDCSQSDFLRKNEQLLKCYITATIAEFYYKGARDLISVNDIATLKSNASSIISKSDEVIDICYGLFKKD
jgi:hypothetical protein